MRILFIHNNFPAQYRHLAQHLAADPQNRVVFITKNQDVELPGVVKCVFEPARSPGEQTHRYVQPFERAVLDGQAVFRVLQSLRSAGFIPDVICAHTGWGPGMFVKDIYPESPLLLYCEWFSGAAGGELDFDPSQPTTVDERLRHRASNAAILTDLAACDGGVAPTEWQRSRFPAAFQPLIEVIHDGVDTDYFAPGTPEPGTLEALGLPKGAELITFVGRGMDSYRGFPQFIEALAWVQRLRPNCHAAIIGADRVAYGPPPPGGGSYKDWMLSKVSLDLSRVHFLGNLPYSLYRQVMRASTVHVYLTRPFVLSWSFIEALSMGCLVIASDTAPVREVIEDGHNGFLTEFFDVDGLARKVVDALAAGTTLAPLKTAARATVLERYALSKTLPRHLALLERYAGRSRL